MNVRAVLATVTYGPRDVRFEQVDDPKIVKATDAIITLSATCICGSDLWPYRGLQPMDGPTNMGHEYCGVVVEVATSTRSALASLSSARSASRTTPVRIADTGSSRPACRASSCSARRRLTRAAARGQHSLQQPRSPEGSDRRSARDFRRAGHGLVCRRCCGRRVDSGRRRRCSWTHGRACRQGARRGTRHRHEPAPRAGRNSPLASARPTSSLRAVRRRCARQGAHARRWRRRRSRVCGTRNMTQAIECCRPGGSIGYVGVPHG